MTAIDGVRYWGTIRNVPGATMDRLDEIARITGRTHSELVALAIANFAPPVETRSAAASPGDRAGHRGNPPAPVAVDSTALDSSCGAVDGGQGATRPPAPLTVDFPTIATPVRHVHIPGGPCIFGDRCGR